MQNFMCALIFTCLFASSTQLLGVLTVISTFAPVAKIMHNATPETFFIFDVDEVLIVPTVPTQNIRLTHPVRLKHIEKLQQQLNEEQKEIIWSVIFSQSQFRLIDPQIVPILTEAKEKRVPVVALTACDTGSFGCIKSMEEWRIKCLAGLGVDFAPLAPYKRNLVFKDLKAKRKNSPSNYQSGIIFSTPHLAKGLVLKHFLKETKLQPKTIVFVDDKRENLHSVEAVCAKLGIDFIGYEFTGAYSLHQPELNDADEQLRVQVLQKDLHWLTDAELKARN